MSPIFSRHLEKAFTLLLVLSFTLPLALGIYLRFTHQPFMTTAWLRNATLSGVQNKPAHVDFKRGSILSARFQTACAENYNTDFPGRELLIRSIDELYLRVLHMAPVGVLVGPEFNLHEKAYAEEYCLSRADNGALRPLVEDLRRLQDFCDARRIAFALAITPSKAAIEPETLPAAWRRRFRPGPRYYDKIVPLLREKDVRYVDGHLLTAGMKGKDALPVFPVGGVHWGDPPALATTNSILGLLAKEGLGVEPIRNYQTKISYQPEGQDSDLAQLINTMFLLPYPVEKVAVQPAEIRAGHYRPNLVIIGGSFSEKMLALLGDSRQFSEIEFYFYYKEIKESLADGDLHYVATPAPPMDFQSEVFAADALVLELNEQVMYAPRHLAAFLHDALAALPDPRAARTPFHYESRFDYQWGDILSFLTGECPVSIVSASGIAPPTRMGAFTEKPVASLRLATPPATSDMVLEVTARPFLANGRLARQAARVLVNGQPIGQMEWMTASVSRQTLRIPKNLLSGEGTRLEFYMDNAASPAELGVGPDIRKLGISLTSLQIHAPDEAGTDAVPALEDLPVYQWGGTISLTDKNAAGDAGVKGFTPPGDEGRYTVGSKASLQFQTTPASPDDVVLSVEAKAFLIGGRFERQIVDVYVNRHPIGQWVWVNGSPRQQTATIPRAFLTGHKLQLEFRIERPVSPAELGLGSDDRKLGICISRIQLQQAVRK